MTHILLTRKSVVVLLVLDDLGKKVHALLDDILADHLEGHLFHIFADFCLFTDSI